MNCSFKAPIQTPNNCTQSPLLQVWFSLERTKCFKTALAKPGRRWRQWVKLCKKEYLCVNGMHKCPQAVSVHTQHDLVSKAVETPPGSRSPCSGGQSNAAHGTKPALRSQKTLMAVTHHGSQQATEGEFRETAPLLKCQNTCWVMKAPMCFQAERPWV